MLATFLRFPPVQGMVPPTFSATLSVFANCLGKHPPRGVLYKSTRPLSTQLTTREPKKNNSWEQEMNQAVATTPPKTSATWKPQNWLIDSSVAKVSHEKQCVFTPQITSVQRKAWDNTKPCSELRITVQHSTKKSLSADRRLDGLRVDLSICDNPPAKLYASALTA